MLILQFQFPTVSNCQIRITALYYTVVVSRENKLHEIRHAPLEIQTHCFEIPWFFRTEISQGTSLFGASNRCSKGGQ